MRSFKPGRMYTGNKNLIDNPVKLSDKFWGLHVAQWPFNGLYLKSLTASGVQGQNTITLSATNSEIFVGNGVQTNSVPGVMVAIVVDISGTTVTLDKPNVATFSGQTVLFFGPFVSSGAIGSSPVALKPGIYRTYSNQGLQWYYLNPAKGVFNFAPLRRFIDEIRAVHPDAEFCYNLSGTPSWASARPWESGYAWGNGRGHGAEPADMQDWVDFCIAVADVAPEVKYFEVWNEPSFNYFEKTATGASGQTTVTVNNNTSLVVGQSVTGVGIGQDAKIATGGISGTTITLTVPNSGTVNGTVMFSGQSAHYFSGKEAKLAEMARLAYLAIKSRRPDAKILSAGPSNIQGISLGTWLASKTHAHFTASAQGFSFAGNDGAGTTMLDWADYLCLHTYQISAVYSNRVFDQVRALKRYLKYIGKGESLPLFASEFGFIHGAPLAGTTCAIGDTSVPVSGSPATNIYQNMKLLDPSGALVAHIASNNASSLTLAEPARLALTGSARVTTQQQLINFTARFILSVAAAGFERAIYFNWDSGSYAMNIDPVAASAIGDILHGVKGKTVIAVTEPILNGPLTFWFDDGTQLIL